MQRGTMQSTAISRLNKVIWTMCIWAALVLAEIVGWTTALVFGPREARARSGAQGLVEWSLAAAVLAFVGIAAWQLAGTAITDAVNRTIGSLNRAGV